MTTFFSLLTTAFSCIFYGAITTAVVMIILFFLLKTISEGIVRSMPFYIIGIILAILLIGNLSTLIGAVQVKNATEGMEITLRQLTENSYGIVNAKESQFIFDSLVETYPLLGTYLQIADFSGTNIFDLATDMPSVIRKELNHIIWREIGWSIGYILIACFLAILFEKKGMRKSREHTHRKISTSEFHHRRRY